MASNIPPKLRETARQQYYTKGEVEKDFKIGQYKTHIAEPGSAANILQRNTYHFEDRLISPKAPLVRTGGYIPGLYVGRVEEINKEYSLKPNVGSLSEAKLIKAREYAE